MPDWPTMSPLFSVVVAGHLRVVDFADVAEQVRRQRRRDTARVGTCSTTTSGSSKSSRRAVTAATCASVASCTIGDRPVRRLAPMAIDDLADARLVDAEHRGQQPDRCGSGPSCARGRSRCCRSGGSRPAPGRRGRTPRRAARAAPACAGGCSRPSPRTSRAARPAAPRSSPRGPKTTTVIRYWRTRQPDADPPAFFMRRHRSY